MTEGIDNPDVRHETSDVNIRAILGFGLGLIVVAVFIHVTVWLLFMFFEGRETHRVAAEFPQVKFEHAGSRKTTSWAVTAG